MKTWRRLRLLVCFAALAMAVIASEKPRVFVTDSQSWEMSGGFGASGGTAAGVVKGGARPQTAEIMKTFGQRCPEVTVTNNRDRADYIILLDHEGGKGWGRKDNKVVVFNKEGDMIHSGSTRSLGNSVKDACKAIKEQKPAEGEASKDPKSQS